MTVLLESINVSSVNLIAPIRFFTFNALLILERKAIVGLLNVHICIQLITRKSTSLYIACVTWPEKTSLMLSISFSVYAIQNYSLGNSAYVYG